MAPAVVRILRRCVANTSQVLGQLASSLQTSRGSLKPERGGGAHSDCRCSWARPRPDCWTPFIITIVYTTCDASRDCNSKPGIFLSGRLILQHASFIHCILRHAQSARST